MESVIMPLRAHLKSCEKKTNNESKLIPHPFSLEVDLCFESVLKWLFAAFRACFVTNPRRGSWIWAVTVMSTLLNEILRKFCTCCSHLEIILHKLTGLDSPAAPLNPERVIAHFLRRHQSQLQINSLSVLRSIILLFAVLWSLVITVDQTRWVPLN